ncbi:MAG: hypothetical protein QW327_05575 [Candidatus Odinarchaeota archaeon]
MQNEPNIVDIIIVDMITILAINGNCNELSKIKLRLVIIAIIIKDDIIEVLVFFNKKLTTPAESADTIA